MKTTKNLSRTTAGIVRKASTVEARGLVGVVTGLQADTHRDGAWIFVTIKGAGFNGSDMKTAFRPSEITAVN